jgi:hypothetical protein
MAESERGRADNRHDERRDAARTPADDGLTGWLRRAITQRPREIWVMEPDGRMHKVRVEG